MNTSEIAARLHQGFGDGVSVTARRPGRIYQITLPAYLSDGDGAFIYVRPAREGRVVMTDLGHTYTRLSYSRTITAAAERTLARLAERHGFQLDEGEICTEMPVDELLAGAMGLVQIESSAEAVITAAAKRGVRAEAFRAAVRDALKEIFPSKVEFDYRAPDDPAGIYSLDALVATPVRLAVSLVPNDLDAERAIGTKHALERSFAGTKHRWVAVPRNMNDLQERTRLRLANEMELAVGEYTEGTAEKFAARLRGMAYAA